MKNIVFSTTRQWNPGDEIILQGIRSIFGHIGVEHNSIIYNRHPDIRSEFQELQMFRTSKLRVGYARQERARFIEANLRYGFFDNSLKPESDCSFVDWVVVAGTPEWCNGRMSDLYSLVAKHNLPLMVLGVGGGYRPHHPAYGKILRRAKAFVVRDQNTLNDVRAADLQADLLPCPALLAAPEALERRVTSVRKIALVYQAARAESVINNSYDDSSYDAVMMLYSVLIEKYGRRFEFEVVCHYVDEILLAMRDMPGLKVSYSFESSEYVAIYSEYDFVIGPRVHGIGAAASVGVPGIALSHDSRGSTCKGFLADVITDLRNQREIFLIFERAIEEVDCRSNALALHKKKTMGSFISIVATALNDGSVEYDADEIVREKSREYTLEESYQCVHDWG